MIINNLDVNIPSELQHASVAELIDETGDWKWSALNNWLPSDILLQIRSFPPPNMNYGQDELMGTRNHCDIFVVSDMYKILSGISNMENNPL
jgi:hypothetical protein